MGFSLIATACAAPVGDFGRPQPSYLHDEIIPRLGGVTAFVRGEPVSLAPLTDDERELRDLSYAILMPPYERQHWERALAEMRHSRILPDDLPRFDPQGYADVLLVTPHRSSTARYARLIEDMRADMARAGPFFTAARRVVEMDAVRQRALSYMSYLPAPERYAAAARIAENRMLIAWVGRRFEERMAGYRAALKRLVVATPAPAAIAAERSLRALEDRLAQFLPATETAALATLPAEGGLTGH